RFDDEIPSDLTLDADAPLIDARRPVLVRVGHHRGPAHSAQKRKTVRIRDGPGRSHDGAWRLDVYERVDNPQSRSSAGADHNAGGWPPEPGNGPPAGAKDGLGVHLIGQA